MAFVPNSRINLAHSIIKERVSIKIDSIFSKIFPNTSKKTSHSKFTVTICQGFSCAYFPLVYSFWFDLIWVPPLHRKQEASIWKSPCRLKALTKIRCRRWRSQALLKRNVPGIFGPCACTTCFLLTFVFSSFFFIIVIIISIYYRNHVGILEMYSIFSGKYLYFLPTNIFFLTHWVFFKNFLNYLWFECQLPTLHTPSSVCQQFMLCVSFSSIWFYCQVGGLYYDMCKYSVQLLPPNSVVLVLMIFFLNS